ncbi:MAG TPA: fibronectin type III domain-containing protein [Candidatus Thermoplasmatota archaeon]|nr:fibronectin type III domain-containing protein [Candidatus Thermoplasmatota archaeon]
MVAPPARGRALLALFAIAAFLAAYATAALLDGPGDAPFAGLGASSGETVEFFGANHATVTLGLDASSRAGGFISAQNLAPGDIVKGRATLDTSTPLDAAAHGFGFRASVSIEGARGADALDAHLLVHRARWGGADILPTLVSALDADGDARLTLRELAGGVDGLAPPASRAAGGTVLELDLMLDPALGGTGESLAGQTARVTFTFGLTEAPHDPPAPTPTTTVPGAPTGLLATQAGDGIALTWLAPASDGGSPILGYRILRAEGAGPMTLLAERGATPFYDDAAVQPGRTYRYQVAASNSVGTGAASNQASATVASEPPVVTLRLSPPAPDGFGGWYASRPLASFEPSDPNATVVFVLGGVEREYLEPFVIPEGESRLIYRAVLRGVESEPLTRLLRVDVAPPVIASGSVSSASVRIGGGVDVGATATDADSGLATVKLVARAPSGASVEQPLASTGSSTFATRFSPAEVGTWSLALVATDIAGHASESPLGTLVVAPASEPINLTRNEPTPPTGEPEPGQPGPSAPTQETVREPEPAVLVFTSNSTRPARPDEGVGGDVIVRVANVKNVPRTIIVLIGPDGREHVLARGSGETRWNTTGYENGYYRVETREENPDGSTTTVASARVLVFNPRASPLETAAAMATGVAAAMISSAALSAGAGGTMSTLSSVAGARMFDFLGFLREGAAAIGEDKLRDRTKFIGHRGKRSLANLRSLTAGLIAVVVFALFFTWEAVEGWDFDQYFEGLPVVGGAAVVFFAMAWSSEILLAQLSGARTKFKLLVSGTIALAFSSTLLRSAFGYAGFIEKDERGDDSALAQRRLAAFRSIAVYGAVASTTVIFHYVGLWWSFDFAEAGIAIALTTLATSSMPFRPLPGQEVWAWSKPMAIACCAGAFALYFLYNVALIDPGVVMLIGLLGGALFAVAAFVVPKMGASLSPKGEEGGETGP